MKTERRHELQTNELADRLGRFIARVRPYSRLIAAAILAVVMLLAAVGYVTAKSTARASVGWEQFFQGFYEQDDDRLASTAEGYYGTTAAVWARLALADMNLAEGSFRLMTDKVAAKDLLQRAATNYRTVLGEAKQDLVLQRAHLGLGRTYEAMNQLDQARRAYSTLLSNWPDSALAKIARERVANLDRSTTKHFYDWLAAYQPPRPVSRQPGTPGRKPAFDLDNLGADDIKLPSALDNKTPTGTDTQGPLLPQPGSQGLEEPEPDSGTGAPLPVPVPATTPGESPAQTAPENTAPPSSSDKGAKPQAAAPAETTP